MRAIWSLFGLTKSRLFVLLHSEEYSIECLHVCTIETKKTKTQHEAAFIAWSAVRCLYRALAINQNHMAEEIVSHTLYILFFVSMFSF